MSRRAPRRLAEDLYQLRGFPPDVFNVYLIGNVVVDAGGRHSGRRILRQVAGRGVSAHALTHVHPDHQGASRQICETLGVPLWCGSADADAMEDGRFRWPPNRKNRLLERLFAGPPHPVARHLEEGDRVAGFEVLNVPGHSPGHVAYWRDSDRALVLGDVVLNMNVTTGVRGLREPLPVYTPDPARNRESARRLAALEPALVCFGHGPPLRDTRRFVDFVEGLPT